MQAVEYRWEKQWRPRDADGTWYAGWDNVWDALTDGIPEERVPAGTVLFQQGDPASEVIYLRRGRVQIECVHSSGKKRTICTLFDGLTVGEEACMFGGVWEFRAVAATGCGICRVPAGEFRRRVERTPALALKLLQVSARKNIVLSRVLISDSMLSVRERVIRFLCVMAEGYGVEEDGGVRITIPITHQAAADFLGISRVAVSRCAGELRKLGLTQKRGREVFLPDVAALERAMQA